MSTKYFNASPFLLLFLISVFEETDGWCPVQATLCVYPGLMFYEKGSFACRARAFSHAETMAPDRL